MKWLLSLFVMLIGVVSGFAQATGTNAVTVLEDNIQNAINVMNPIILGLLGLSVVIGLALWFLRKKGR